MELIDENMTLDDLARALKAEGEIDTDNFLALAQESPGYQPKGLFSRFRKNNKELYREAQLSADGVEVLFNYWFDSSVTDIRVRGTPIEEYGPEYETLAVQMAEDNNVEHKDGMYSTSARPTEQDVISAVRRVKNTNKSLGLMVSFHQYEEKEMIAPWARNS
ncbi:hypothetical protein ACFL3V_01330 [Nanoarchaeota archaeon]